MCICDVLPQTISASSLNKPVLLAPPEEVNQRGQNVKNINNNIIACMLLDFIATVYCYLHFKDEEMEVQRS